jgi:diguanylate cyclase (GGDEF)-like protein
MLCELKTDENGRIRALDRLDVLDTAEEKPFEKIVTLVQQVLHVPICAVSLIDRDRQWFKAKRGLAVDETARDISFCTHAIQAEAPFIVNNATLDKRFASNPLVTGDPNIRSYAGVPLKMADGYVVGTLCAIDTVARDFPASEIAILSNFAKVIVDELELRQIASSDSLTGALSRRAWMEKAESELKRAQRYDRPVSILIMDIDRFKTVNDTFGHLVGDIVIKQLSDLASMKIRDTDALGRYGGEEFVILMPETDLADAMKLAERIRKSFSEIEIPELDGIRSSISIGVAERAKGEVDSKAILERADGALYEAKNGGRNRCMSARWSIGDIKREVA